MTFDLSGKKLPRPQVIVFDLGKVLVDFDYSIAGRRIAAKAKRTPEEVQQFLTSPTLLVEYESGRMTREAFFSDIQREIGFAGTYAEFCSFFADIFSEMPQMIALQQALRNCGFPTFIFSNTNDLAIEHIRRNFPFFGNFEGYILSYEVGAMKPKPQIYHAMEAMTGKIGAAILYIDDREENIAAGQQMGWQTILQVTPEQTVALIKNAGLLG